MLNFQNKYAKNYVYSQFGEEGILLEVLSRMKIEKGFSVEFGANNGTYCSNTALLLERGWSGRFIEADFDLYQQCHNRWQRRPDVRVICSRVEERNIAAFVDSKVDLLSLDTDGQDYALFKAVTVKPKIVIIEIDSSYPPDVYAFNSDGAGTYRNTLELGISKGYFLLCHTGNLVLIDNKYRDLFPEIEGDGLSNSELYFNRGWIQEAA